ncbi:hypothetical protein F4776DRAFT_630645 [Hypoxylon sp. NC0597]|nr:hypothetical protein F4776DRAFT_630645 [Hypoxylon sp. NC0597]
MAPSNPTLANLIRVAKTTVRRVPTLINPTSKFGCPPTHPQLPTGVKVLVQIATSKQSPHSTSPLASHLASPPASTFFLQRSPHDSFSSLTCIFEAISIVAAMMASDTSRPPTGNGGSRPPTSRFVEGSMNDRVSAAPPAQFLGPEQMKEFEKQFYTDKSTSPGGTRKTRRRPFSESGVSEKVSEKEHILTHRKSIGFFGRVRDALGWNSSRSNGSAQKQNTVRKHSSLQEPMLSPPRPDHLRAAKSHSEMYNIPQLSNLGSGGDRPTREDVLASYNQLMATGFFQSHAIQSTRHARPASHDNDHRSVPPLPSIPGSAPCSPAKPPPRTSSIDATRVLNSPRSPTGADNKGRKISRPESEDELMPTLNNVESLYSSIRGRKRNRTDAEGVTNVESPGASTSSSFAQPLKRVAKKLRKMPSSAKDVEMADGVIHLPPSVSTGGTLYLKEKAVRMRSPSPAPPEVLNRRAERQQLPRKPRRTLSGSSKGEGNRLRKRRASPSLRSRSSPGPGFETWEIAGERMSLDSIRPDATVMPENGAVQAPLQFREATALSVVPDANRGIPSVPRIPDRYHFYHKPGARLHRNSDVENENAEAEWQYGEAL